MIALIQSVKELTLLKKVVKDPFDVFALNLEVATYCKINQIKFSRKQQILIQNISFLFL